MNRGDFFLLCVQTNLLVKQQGVKFTMQTLQKASELPEEAYGAEKDLGQAAMDFVAFQADDKSINPFKAKKPEWLVAWEEGQANRVQVRRNETSFADTWWMAAEEALTDSLRGEGLPFPNEMGRLITTTQRGLIVSRQSSELFQAWGRSIPGWEQEPFTFEEVAE